MLRDADWHVRWRAAAAIVEFGEAAIDALAPALKDYDWHLRYAAVWALAKIGGIQAAAVLETMAADRNFHVRTEAARVLGLPLPEEPPMPEN
jgi:HEAT repeat protein